MRMTITPVSRSPAMIGALDRRRAAPARQQRGVQVEAAVARRVEDRLRQDQPVGDDDRDVGGVRREELLRCRDRAASSA